MAFAPFSGELPIFVTPKSRFPFVSAYFGVSHTRNAAEVATPFSTWTRGLAWIMLGYAELLEFMATLPDTELEKVGGRDADPLQGVIKPSPQPQQHYMYNRVGRCTYLILPAVRPPGSK